jgi:hypothetical protein
MNKMQLNSKTFNDTGQTQKESSVPLNERDASESTNTKRMSVSLAGDAAQLLDFLSKSQGITQNEALRKAIATEAYIRQEIGQGTKVLLQKPNGDIREVVFR